MHHETSVLHPIFQTTDEWDRMYLGETREGSGVMGIMG